MAENRDTYFSNKKTVVQFVLSLYVFFIHFSAFSVFRSDALLQTFFDLLLPVTHVAVPLFFMISGALFYRNFTLSLTLKKWKSRFFSLCIPYLTWNTVWLLLAFLGYYTPLGAFLGGVKAPFSWINIFNGIFLHGFFEPFWFILQLIVLTALCPVFYLLLKKKWIGLVSIAAIYLMLCLKVPLNNVLINNPGMVICYLAGAWIGLHYFDMFAERKNKKRAVMGFGVYVVCCILHGIRDLMPQWYEVMQLPLAVMLVSCGAFWTMFDCFEMRMCPGYLGDSFLIYALHSFVGAALSKMLAMVMPKGQGYVLLTAVIVFPATIAIICLLGRFLEKYWPGGKRILTGK